MKNIFLLLLAGGLFLLSFAPGLFSEKEDEAKPQGRQSTESGGTNPLAGESKTDGTMQEAADEARQWEERFQELLSGVKGVGKVNVMITLSDAGEKIVLKDEKNSTDSLKETDGVGGSRANLAAEKEENTVLDAGNTPYVTKELSAQVAGILVICEGGGNADVVVQIVSAAEALFGVPTHRIVVLEMK